jgi:hypothetical protein
VIARGGPRFFGTRLACLVALGAVSLAAQACGGGSSGSRVSYATYLAGQVPRSELPDIGPGGNVTASSSTVPLAQQNPITALFTSIGVFQSCLKGLGVTFIGAPDPSNPSDPANNPDYLKHLATCAAQSNIVQALKAEQTAQQNLTQAQIHTENKDYLKWRTCMIGRGWTIPQPTPNSQGLLFSFGANSGPSITPPPGKTLFSSGDIESCATQAAGKSLGQVTG